MVGIAYQPEIVCMAEHICDSSLFFTLNQCS